MTDGIYYEDQADWPPSDYYALWRYFDRLAEYVGPTQVQAQRPEHRSARIQARRNTIRDEELASIDLSQMPPESRLLLRAVLRSQQRYELALENFPNLGGLSDAVRRMGPEGFDQYPPAVQALLLTHD